MMTMKELVKSDGFIVYRKLRLKIGNKVVNSLIEHNILHLRPTTRCSYDFPDRLQDCLDGPLVTAESGCSLFAMRYLVNYLEKR